MIDICFSENECGMLKMALGKNDVVCGWSLLDQGKLAAPDFDSARKEWIDEFFWRSSNRKKHMYYIKDKRQADDILKRAKEGEIPRIWVSSCPRSRCGFFQLIHSLRDIADTVYVVEMPNDTGYDKSGTDRSWGEADPDMAAECLTLQRELSAEEKKYYSDYWERLVAENTELRVNEIGYIKSVPKDYLDEEIYSYSPDGEVSIIKVMAEMIGRSKHIITDSFVLERIETMIKQGRYEIIKTEPGKDYYTKTVIKKNI